MKKAPELKSGLGLARRQIVKHGSQQDLILRDYGIEPGLADPAIVCAPEFLRKYKSIAGGVAAAVLFAFYEECFKSSGPGTSILSAPIARWRLDGLMSVKEFYRALHPFGYRYYSRVKFEAARSAQREWIHPDRHQWLLYILVHDQSSQTDLLIRNGVMIGVKLAGTPSVLTIPAELRYESIAKIARMDARCFMAQFDL